jgi:hypothetical protein
MIPIFIGTSNYEDAWIERILAYSLLKNTEEKLDIYWLRPKYFPKWNKDGWGTPFTNYRYAIPHLMNYKGKAIYMDCDQINFRDIAELYEEGLDGKIVSMVWDALMWNGSKWRDTPHERGFYCDSVMVIDCKKFGDFIGSIDSIKNAKFGFKRDVFDRLGCPDRSKGKELIKELNPRWNAFDGRNTSYIIKSLKGRDKYSEATKQQPEFPLEEIWHLHFTGMSTQPWHPKYSPWAKGILPREDILKVMWELNREVSMIENRGEKPNGC